MADRDADHAVVANDMVVVSAAIGIGGTKAATARDLLALIAREIGVPPPGAVLATIDRRECLAYDVARELGLDVVSFDAATLARVPQTTIVSLRALASVGTPSVAEAAALAAIGEGARLVIARRTGRACTCALAVRA